MIDYHQVLADLESRRAAVVSDLDAAIRAVRLILHAGAQVPQTPIRTATQGRENHTKVVFDFLVSEVPRSFSPKAIAQATGFDEKAVRGILNRLSKGKKIDKPSRGKYRGKAQTQATSAAA